MTGNIENTQFGKQTHSTLAFSVGSFIRSFLDDVTKRSPPKIFATMPCKFDFKQEEKRTNMQNF